MYAEYATITDADVELSRCPVRKDAKCAESRSDAGNDDAANHLTESPRDVAMRRA